MKDLYGKQYGKYRFLSIRQRLSQRLGLMHSDLRNLGRVLAKRPVVIPAFLIILCSFTCYYSASFLPSLLISILAAASGIYYSLYPVDRKISGISVFLVVIMLCSVLTYIGFFISSRLNAVIENGHLDSGKQQCVVMSVSYDLSGNLDMTVRLDSGALAKVRFYCEHGVFDPGDQLILFGNIREPDKAGNPGETDYREYLRKKGIIYTISCDRYSVVSEVDFPIAVTGFLQRLFFEFRSSVFEAVTASFDERFKALTAAVCIGDRSLISKSVERDFRLSCCSHLLAVSGTHFSGFLVCLPLILKALNIRRKNELLTHVVFCILIGCLTGWSDSVTRAAIMSICVIADREWLSALSLASMIMIVADPFCALSSGFQMSFCAVIAIKVYSVKISDFLLRLHLNEGFVNLISPAVSAFLGMIPFWSETSMRPDPEHLLIQIAGSFLAGCACTFFVPCVILCYLLPFWDRYLSSPLLLCLDALYKFVAAGGSLSVKSGMPVHLSKCLLVILGLVVFLYMIPPCMFRKIFMKPTAAVLAFAIGLESFSVLKRSDCRVVFADVGQGDCCLIITPDKTCLIDAGTYKEGSSTVCDLLDYYGIYQVDYCVMSHWDSDHAGGFAALSDQGRVKSILTSYVPSSDDKDKDKDVQEFFISNCSDPESELSFRSILSKILAGDRIDLSDSVYLDVLYPSEISGGGNESSLVVMLHIVGDEETSMLFTGDIGTATETFLIEKGIDLDCDILKVAHHGSKYSSSEEFIDACSPDIAVISVGAHNFYGHPSPQTLSRFDSYGCEIFRTDTEGAVVLEY